MGKSRLSIGMPVYNGEKFLAETLNSLLNQTFRDFELIICDNASTDRTREMCEGFASRDQRIRYYANDQNLGAAWNFNRVFQLSSADYFKWAAHDDLCDREYLERCVQVLDRDSSIVLCHSWSKAIDEKGTPFRVFKPKPRLASFKPYERYYECICVPHPQVHVFGVVRSSVLKRTRLIGNFPGSDRTLLGELALLGRLYEIPEYLFFNRKHSLQSYRVYSGVLQAWFDPARARNTVLRTWRLLFEHFRTVTHSPQKGHQKVICNLCLVWWVRLHWRKLLAETVSGTSQRIRTSSLTSNAPPMD